MFRDKSGITNVLQVPSSTRFFDAFLHIDKHNKATLETAR